MAPEALYEAWLDAEGHAAITGARATSDGRAGGAFTAWGDYIEGTHLELSPHHRIVQTWRTTDFPAGAAHSKLIVLFEKAPGGTLVTFVHTDIPEGQGASYEEGWVKFYLEPIRKHAESTRKASKSKSASKGAATSKPAKSTARTKAKPAPNAKKTKPTTKAKPRARAKRKR